MSVQQQQTAWKSKAVIALMIQILVAIMFSMSAFAAGEVIDDGTGWSDEVGAGSRDWGYNYWAGGYRTYMEGEGGKLVQQVTDIYFTDPNAESSGMVKFRGGAIGGGYAVNQVPHTAIPADGLEPPFYNYEAWGPEMDAWFENTQTHFANKDLINADAWIYGAFSYGDDTEELMTGFSEGRYRIVVEALYWWRPVHYTGVMMQNAKGARVWIYGTVKNGAMYDSIIKNKLSQNGLPGGGAYLGNYTNNNLATALTLDDTDTGFSGFTPIPDGAGANTSGEGGIYTYSEIQQSKVGYGMHIIHREKAEEKWYTYKSPSGATGGPEDASPEMPDIPGIQTGGKFRPVTIIKYYEERTIQQDGKTKSDWKTVSGPYSRPQVCRSIVIIYFE